MHSAPHDSDLDLSQDVQEDEALDNDPTDFGQEENEEEAPNENLDNVQHQLDHNLASLFLKLDSVLHISDMALQEVIQQLNQTVLLSEPLLRKAIQQILNKYGVGYSGSIVREIVNNVKENNLLLKMTDAGQSLSTASKRTSYFQREFSMVMPIE